MIKINTSISKAGMIVAKPIFDSKGKLLIAKGTRLKESYIGKLLFYDIEHIYVYKSKEDLSQMADIISQEMKLMTLSQTKQTINDIHFARHVDLRKLEGMISDIIDELMSNKGLLLNLADIRTIDEYTFGHSVNVCILSLIMGMGLNYDKEALRTLGIGALLHDVGKVYINNNILNKPQILNNKEYELIKQHSILGYEAIRKIEEISKEAKWIVRDHHERYDGKGYPNGIWGENIHIYSRIVTICDAYDALTSNRVYRAGISPCQAVEYLISMGNHQFDFELVKLFLKNLCIY